MGDRAELRARLLEAMAWWHLERPLVLAADGTLHRRSQLRMSEDRAADDTEAAVRQILAWRADRLRRSGWDWASRVTRMDGRILVFLTELNLKDGAAFVASQGLIGDLNFPACDLWVGLTSDLGGRRHASGPGLVSWIPEELVSLAQQGVDANPEECLVWADELAPQLNEDLMAYR